VDDMNFSSFDRRGEGGVGLAERATRGRNGAVILPAGTYRMDPDPFSSGTYMDAQREFRSFDGGDFGWFPRRKIGTSGVTGSEDPVSLSHGIPKLGRKLAAGSAETQEAGRWEHAGAELLGRRDAMWEPWRRERSWRWLFGNDWYDRAN